VPGHAFMGAIMGYFVGQAKFREGRRGVLLATGYFTAMILHGLYDFPLLTMRAMSGSAGQIPAESADAVGGLVLATLVVLVVEGTWALRLARRLRAEQQVLA